MGKKRDPLENHVSGQANEPISRPAHSLTYQQVIEEISSNKSDGLTASEAKSRIDRFGRNEFGETGGVQPIKILIRQVANAMTLVMRTIIPIYRDR